ncbi:MAG TPA: PRC-barrel domain-containing protein [Anaerolineales bacterium]|nr:PRC-barrel domain-containing protein [Anaerolineales bacterium]
MRLEKGTEVFTAAGEKIGTLNRVVIDARTRDVTDLVVERGLWESEKVIPIGLVDTEKEDRIMLRETNQGVDSFLDYETTHYVLLGDTDAPYENLQTYYWYPPVNFPTPTGGVLPNMMPDYALRTETSIPQGRVAISEGAQVISADKKHIGNVEQVIADAESNHVTHFVIGKGFLLKEHRLVPAFWATKVEADKVYLSVRARVFEHLPDYQPSS